MAINGTQASYNRTVGVKLDIDEAIRILPVDDVPLQAFLPTEPTRSVKVEWLEEGYTPSTFSITSFTGTGPWVATVPDASAVRLGDVYQKVGAAYDVQWVVTAINFGTNAVTLTAFANGTTPVNADVLQLIGQYRVEGVDPEPARAVDRVQPFNYTQVGQEAVEVTRTQGKRAMYGLDDAYGHEVQKKFRELAMRFEKSLVGGYRAISGGNDQRFMGGFFFYVTTNTQSGLAANVKTLINNLMKARYSVGGDGNATLFVSPNVKAVISANYDPSARRVERSDQTGGFTVERILTDYGEVTLRMNRHFPQTKGLLVPEDSKRRTFDPYFHEYLAKTGDRDKGQVVGELSLEVKNQVTGGVLTVTDA